MPLVHPTRFLYIVLLVDAATCAAAGALQIAIPGLLTQWLGLETGLLLGTGWFLIAYAAFLVVLARSRTIWSRSLPPVIIANILWGLGCLLLAFGSNLPVSALGQAWLVMQACAVFALAALQWHGRRALRQAAGVRRGNAVPSL